MICKHTEGAGHSCAYVERVNAVVKRAADAADIELEELEDEVGELSTDTNFATGSSARDDKWNQMFHRLMEEMCVDEGLRSGRRPSRTVYIPTITIN